MGQLAFLKMFLLVSIPTDINDNRRHVHIMITDGMYIFLRKAVDIFIP